MAEISILLAEKWICKVTGIYRIHYRIIVIKVLVLDIISSNISVYASVVYKITGKIISMRVLSYITS